MANTIKIVDGDVQVSSATGRPSIVSSSIKLSQDIKEFFEINTLPNGFGAGVERLVGLVQLSDDLFITMAERQIRDGLAQFIYLQNSNQSIPRSAAEKIANVTDILIQKNPTDPTMFYFRVNFVTVDGQQQSSTSSIRMA